MSATLRYLAVSQRLGELRRLHTLAIAVRRIRYAANWRELLLHAQRLDLAGEVLPPGASHLAEENLDVEADHEADQDAVAPDDALEDIERLGERNAILIQELVRHPVPPAAPGPHR